MYLDLDIERARHGYTEEYVAQELGLTLPEYRSRKGAGTFLGSEIRALAAMYKKSFEYLFFQKKMGKL